MTDLFAYAAATHARLSDPDTSHVAASQHEGAHARHCAAILRVLRQTWPEALAAEQIADRIEDVPELDKVAVAKRFIDLLSAGLIVRTDERHKNRNGRPAFRVRAVA